MPDEPTTTTTTVTPMPDPAIVRTTTTTPARSWKEDLYTRFTSRKFIAYLVAVLTAGSGYFGHTLDGPQTMAAILAATAAYLLSESMIDASPSRRE
jgi:hypothetical protein